MEAVALRNQIHIGSAVTTKTVEQHISVGMAPHQRHGKDAIWSPELAELQLGIHTTGETMFVYWFGQRCQA